MFLIFSLLEKWARCDLCSMGKATMISPSSEAPYRNIGVFRDLEVDFANTSALFRDLDFEATGSLLGRCEEEKDGQFS